MALSTYAELQTAIASWAWNAGNADFEPVIPDMVALLESRLNRELRVGDMEATATIALTDGAGTLPADYLEYRRVVANVSPLSVLKMATPEFATGRYPDNPAAYPQYFSIIGSTIKTYPTSTGDLSLTYYQKIPPLATNSTNWLLTKAPDVYLFGALIEAADFMRDMQELQKFSARFDAAMKSLITSDQGSRYSSAVARVSGPTP